MTAITVWVILMLLALLVSSCTGDYEKGWAWGVITPEGEIETEKFLWKRTEVRVDSIEKTEYGDPDNAHQLCKNRHYHDPYTKREYCLPEGFTNMNHLHLYRVN